MEHVIQFQTAHSLSAQPVRATCRCGWQGKWREQRNTAERDAAQHRNEAARHL